MIAVFLVLSKNVLYDYLLNIFKKKWTVYQSLCLIIAGKIGGKVVLVEDYEHSQE
jgi:hypothetical protein